LTGEPPETAVSFESTEKFLGVYTDFSIPHFAVDTEMHPWLATTNFASRPANRFGFGTLGEMRTIPLIFSSGLCCAPFFIALACVSCTNSNDPSLSDQISPSADADAKKNSHAEYNDRDSGVESDDPSDAPLGNFFSCKVSRKTPITVTAGVADDDLISATFLDDNGTPLEGATIRWVTPKGGGWVFPATSTTNSKGVAATKWIAGAGGDSEIRATLGKSTCAIATLSVKKESRARSIYFDFPIGARPDKYSVEITPKTAPKSTYYTAFQFEGGYAGIQPANTPDRSVLFSAWDVDGGPKAIVVDKANSTCGNFGGEGTGQQCWFSHALTVGKTYKFELEMSYGANSTDYTAYFTDDGTRTKLATLRHGKATTNKGMGAFAEDYGAYSASCIDAALREVAYANPQALVGGIWQTIKAPIFRFGGLEAGRPPCVNIDALIDDSAFVLRTGGSQAGDPAKIGQAVTSP